MGTADFGFHAIEQHLPWTDKTNVNGMYCVCPTTSGLTGVQCEITVQRCGKNQHPCFHGSTCITKTKTKKTKDTTTTTTAVINPTTNDNNKNNSEQEESNCDCTSATSKSPLAGHFCQHSATTFCGTSPDDGTTPPRHSFCTNGGMCKDVVVIPTDESQEYVLVLLYV